MILVRVCGWVTPTTFLVVADLRLRFPRLCDNMQVSGNTFPTHRLAHPGPSHLTVSLTPIDSLIHHVLTRSPNHPLTKLFTKLTRMSVGIRVRMSASVSMCARLA